jgi:hypothetical protein
MPEEELKSSANTAIILRLPHGTDDGNYMKWARGSSTKLAIIYGRSADVILTGKPYEIPPVCVSDYAQGAGAAVPDGEVAPPPMSVAATNALRNEAESRRWKEVAKMKIELPKLYADIKNTVSEASWTVLEHQDGYVQAHRDRDPNLLCDIIRATHLTHIRGAHATAMEASDRAAMRQRFADARQRPEQSLADFKTELEELETMVAEATKVARLPDADRAVDYLRKLDKVKYGKMIRSMENAALNGTAMPATVLAAFNYAWSWQDDGQPLVPAVVPPTVEELHHHVMTSMQLPQINNTSKSVAGYPRGARKKQTYEPPDNVTGGNDKNAAEDRSDTPDWFVCWKCGKPGHKRSNCGDIRCMACGKNGHSVESCPLNPEIIEGIANKKANARKANSYHFTTRGDSSDDDRAYDAY